MLCSGGPVLSPPLHESTDDTTCEALVAVHTTTRPLGGEAGATAAAASKAELNLSSTHFHIYTSSHRPNMAQQPRLIPAEELPPNFYYDERQNGVGGSIQGKYFVKDDAIARGDRTEINTFERDPAPGNFRAPDHFLADIPGRPIKIDEAEFQWLFQILQALAAVGSKTQRAEIEKALPYMDGTNPWGTFHYSSGWCDDDRDRDAEDRLIPNAGRVDSRCKRCVLHGLPCISRAFVDQHGKVQVYHQ